MITFFTFCTQSNCDSYFEALKMVHRKNLTCENKNTIRSIVGNKDADKTKISLICFLQISSYPDASLDYAVYVGDHQDADTHVQSRHIFLGKCMIDGCGKKLVNIQAEKGDLVQLPNDI